MLEKEAPLISTAPSRSTEIAALYARFTPALSSEDSIGRAAELLRSAGLSLIPILEHGDPVGVVTLSSLRNALGSETSHAADQPVSQFMQADFELVQAYEPITAVRQKLQESALDTLIVVDAGGQYMGVISAADLLSRPTATPKPPLIGGMATPLGVYLTTGSASAGASSLGLVLTGALLLTLFTLSDLLVYLFAWGVENFTSLPLLTWTRLPILNSGTLADIAGGLVPVLVFPLFLLLMRALPLSGTHAAEHQVVHAIERGERLTLEVVKRMPRVHPRCGTNLAAGATLFVFLIQSSALQTLGELGLLGALLLTIALWRPFGNFLQKYFTTKPATDKQILNAIQAGESLLKKQLKYGAPSLPFVRRLTSSGLPQVLLGWMLAYSLFELVQLVLRIQLPLIAAQ